MKRKVILPEVLFGKEIRAEDVFRVLQQSFLDEVNRNLEEKKMSKSQLAMKMGVSRSAISKILNPEGNLSLKKIADIATALKIKIKFSFENYQYQNQAEYVFRIDEK